MPGAIVEQVGSIETRPDPRREHNLPNTISAIGQPSFEVTLLGFLNRLCGAGHIQIFRITDDAPDIIAAASVDESEAADDQARLYIRNQLWHGDPWYLEAKADPLARPLFSHLDAKHADQRELRDFLYYRMHLRERVIICGRGPDGILGLSMLRSDERGAFTSNELAGLRATSDIAFSMIQRHFDLLSQTARISGILNRLPEIARTIESAREALPKREAQVASRILYGLTTEGIALDLDIGRETVMTYRKRVYDRLCISSNRELIIWYLSLIAPHGDRSGAKLGL
ncbi:helix-turn-helix transcriptional regulator [Sphingobium sp.]|uniref:helix-turn-helix transcriptional regulator n=1 Tax=Sphingobium sp. TaxID=1912891 RepID=UPI0028BF1AD9|nr:helix-turn-helix transcriptional regulator [Sphingobium sp.]